MEIYKFGGSSLGTTDRIKNVAAIINSGTNKIVVLSANGKSTDLLVAIIKAIKQNNTVQADHSLNILNDYYRQLIIGLYTEASYESMAAIALKETLTGIQSYFSKKLSQEDEAWLISRGELFSTILFSLFLKEKEIDHNFIHATEIIHLDKTGQTDTRKIKVSIQQWISTESNTKLSITQGFICSDYQGKMATLGRGGSDFTASLLAAACRASVVQIWSDVDGFLNNDPAFVRGALPLDYLSFDEAAELAYFGARILHPSTIYPASEVGIPVLLKNTLNPRKKGTLISSKQQNGNIKAIAAKDNICSVTIHSDRMLLAYGFLRKVFEVFERYETAVDMVTTSEVSVSVTIDNARFINKIVSDLQQLGTVNIKHHQSLICVVGDAISENKGNVDRIFSELQAIPIRMISYGAAKNSISFLVHENHKIKALEALHQLLQPSQTTEYQYV